jgi:predicted MFS family arabinose efflux permease
MTPPGPWRSILQVLRGAVATPALWRLQGAWVCVALGLYADLLIISLYAYEVGGAAAVGLVGFARFMPAALLTPWMALAGDRFARRDVMLAVAVGRTVLCALIALAIWEGASVAVVAILSALASVLSTGYRPAQSGLLPLLSPSPRQMAAANAVWSGADSLGVLAGSVLGGAVMAAAGAGAAMLAVGVLFALAAVLVLGIARDRPPAHRRRSDGASLWREVTQGFETVLRDRKLRTLTGLLTLAALVEGALDTLIIVAALGLLGLGEAGAGQLYAAWGLGGIVGGAVSLGLLSRGRLASGLTLGCVCMGLPLVVLGLWATVPVAFGALLLYGVGFGLQETAAMSLLQRLAADDVLARVFGVTETVYLLAVGLGAPLGAVLVETAGPTTAFLAVGIVLPLFALARWRALSRYEDASPVPERAFSLLRRLPMFAPLPVATLEILAARMTPLEAGAGDEVVTQGSPGEAFFVVADGAVVVSVDGRPVRFLGEGDGFGEIALLRRAPRTATVHALRASRLYRLDGDLFVGAVTGHPRSSDAASGLVDERLRHAAPARD